MKIIKLFEEFSNVFTIFNFDKITKDWKVFENDTLDDLRNYQLNEDGSLSFSMKTDSKSITINKLEKLIQNLSNEMDILNVTYWKMSNFSNIFICDENILKFSSNRLEHSVDEWKMANKFVGKDIPWIHIDLAAAGNKGGLGLVPTETTGFGVRFGLELVTSFLK